MDDTLSSIINEAIRLELNLAKLYLNFHLKFPDDANFWWKLTMEEENHASLLRSAREYFIPADVFPRNMLSSDLAPLVEINRRVENLLVLYQRTPPPRKQGHDEYCRRTRGYADRDMRRKATSEQLGGGDGQKNEGV